MKYKLCNQQVIGGDKGYFAEIDENEKSYLCFSRSAGAVKPLGKLIAVLLPINASLSIIGPPGKPSPINRAILSNASLAASSIVAPLTTTSVAKLLTCKIEECPPLTSRQWQDVFDLNYLIDQQQYVLIDD